MDLERQLRRLRPQLALAAQSALDRWRQDSLGYDIKLGYGGACYEVADAMRAVLVDLLPDQQADVWDQDLEGWNHFWLVVGEGEGAIAVDVPWSAYEVPQPQSGEWLKLPDVRLRPEDVMIARHDYYWPEPPHPLPKLDEMLAV